MNKNIKSHIKNIYNIKHSIKTNKNNIIFVNESIKIKDLNNKKYREFINKYGDKFKIWYLI